MNPYNEPEMRAYLLMQAWPNENVFNAWGRIYRLWNQWEMDNEDDV